MHQIFMSPSNEGMAIEETLYYSRVWEIVVHGPKLLLHAFETGVHCKSCAINIVQDLGIVLLQEFDRLVYL